MENQKSDIILISTNNWNGFWFQRQEFATRFSEEGYRVFYINKFPQRIPTFNKIIRHLKTKKMNDSLINPVPKGIFILSPLFFPPLPFLNIFNLVFAYFFCKNIIRKYSLNNPYLITYQPSKIVHYIINFLRPIKIVYVNTHNYNADPTCPKSLFKSESLLVKKANILLADAQFNVKRLQAYHPSIQVGRAMPGVNSNAFASSYRGDEVQRKKNIYFFGDIGNYLDIDLYNQASKDYKVHLIGVVNPQIKELISNSIIVLPPVAPTELPNILKDADIITIWYKQTDYVNAILPAKFFECLATKKPFFISGLPEASPYLDAVYDINGSYEIFTQFVSNLHIYETKERLQKKALYSTEADWKTRYEQFKYNIGLD